ncbi:hypothetical protein WJX81_001506 [Elliptochloris bilobata]|uniref:RING-type domain-containing protein n=1 Tax=Elliptochloris bilobata TaxID=381761 RepID=A0AAW1RXJ0_9CHLO
MTGAAAKPVGVPALPQRPRVSSPAAARQAAASAALTAHSICDDSLDDELPALVDVPTDAPKPATPPKPAAAPLAGDVTSDDDMPQLLDTDDVVCGRADGNRRGSDGDQADLEDDADSEGSDTGTGYADSVGEGADGAYREGLEPDSYDRGPTGPMADDCGFCGGLPQLERDWLQREREWEEEDKRKKVEQEEEEEKRARIAEDLIRKEEEERAEQAKREEREREKRRKKKEKQKAKKAKAAPAPAPAPAPAAAGRSTPSDDEDEDDDDALDGFMPSSSGTAWLDERAAPAPAPLPVAAPGASPTAAPLAAPVATADAQDAGGGWTHAAAKRAVGGNQRMGAALGKSQPAPAPAGGSAEPPRSEAWLALGAAMKARNGPRLQDGITRAVRHIVDARIHNTAEGSGIRNLIREAQQLLPQLKDEAARQAPAAQPAPAPYFPPGVGVRTSRPPSPGQGVPGRAYSPVPHQQPTGGRAGEASAAAPADAGPWAVLDEAFAGTGRGVGGRGAGRGGRGANSPGPAPPAGRGVRGAAPAGRGQVPALYANVLPRGQQQPPLAQQQPHAGAGQQWKPIPPPRAGPHAAARQAPPPRPPRLRPHLADAFGAGVVGQDEDPEDCCFCMERAATEVYQPCGHKNFCTFCTDKIMARDRLCPICRTQVVRWVHEP